MAKALTCDLCGHIIVPHWYYTKAFKRGVNDPSKDQEGASPAGRLRRAKPSSPAQHHVQKLYLQTELPSTFVAHVGSHFNWQNSHLYDIEVADVPT
jgi:hypothetical protein